MCGLCCCRWIYIQLAVAMYIVWVTPVRVVRLYIYGSPAPASPIQGSCVCVLYVRSCSNTHPHGAICQLESNFAAHSDPRLC